MAKRLTLLLAGLMVLGFVIAGCGDDESDTANEANTAPETATKQATDDKASTDTETGTDSNSENNGGDPPTSEDWASSCEEGVKASPELPDEVKDDLQDVCDKARSGDAEDVREAAEKVCRTIIKETVLAGAPGRDKALKACGSGPGR